VNGAPGDERGQFRAAHLAHAQRLYSVALGGTGNPATAKQLVNDVFEDAWKQRDEVLQLEGDDQRGFLLAILKNKIVDSFRLGAGRFERLDDDPDDSMDQRFSKLPSTSQTALQREVVGRCWDVIANMPPIRRMIFFLLTEECTNREIADHLAITQSTVRSHLQRGRKELTEKVGSAAEIFFDLEDQNEDGTQR